MPVPLRLIPEDFASLAGGKTNAQLRAHYNVGAAALARWRKESGIQPPSRKTPAIDKIPDWFAEAALTKTNRELVTMSGMSNRTVRWWRSLLCIRAVTEGREPINKLQAPAEFAALVPTLTRNALRLHFGRSLNTIDRWCREAGVRPKAPPRPTVERAVRQFNPLSAPVWRDDSAAGRAADYLRRYGPVIRCDPRGRYDPNGQNWRRGSTVLAPQEVIERAQYLGWPA